MRRNPAARLLFVAVVSSAPAAMAVVGADAADPKKPNWAATDVSEVDEDYPFQGEYIGWVSFPGRWDQSAGLQVVALGNGKFDAVLFPGGLPGAGARGRECFKLSGGRAGSQVALAGSDMQAVVAGNAAAISMADGRYLGSLRKILRTSPTMGLPVPPNGTPLFTETTWEGFVNPKVWPDRTLGVGTQTRRPLRDFTLHAEFRLPYMPYARGQGRANSGIYLQSRYEVQILDSFGLDGKNNECGALYTYRAPDVNMCYPPLAWQTYDIDFRAARFDASGKKVQNARLTVWHNGVLVHDRFDVERKTGAGAAEGPADLPTKLQDHGNPVVFRNVWVVEHGEPSSRNPKTAAQ